VGRITVEKNIGLLVTLERALLDAGYRDFRFLVVGQGAAEPWLRANLRHAGFTGVLEGAALGRAYANMDAFVFPSRTDTFGNVVLEALASGVPAVVTDAGGPKFIVKDGETGLIARSEEEFVRQVAVLLDNRGRQQAMARAARAYALGQSWDAVFNHVLAVYRRMLAEAGQAIACESPGHCAVGGETTGCTIEN
jgi:glycosyltransferase involved in cell wall biosynthesis